MVLNMLSFGFFRHVWIPSFKTGMKFLFQIIYTSCLDESLSYTYSIHLKILCPRISKLPSFSSVFTERLTSDLPFVKLFQQIFFHPVEFQLMPGAKCFYPADILFADAIMQKRGV